MSYIQKKPFTPQEDILLADAVENYGQDWQTVAKLVPGHNAKQCRERWQFALSPSQTIEWDDEMDERLLKLAGQYGNNYEAIAYANGREVGSRMVYPCIIGPGGATAELPRKGDATSDEVSSGMFATIGHKKQWMDHCAQKCDPVLTDDGAVYAYRRADVKREYNNTTNLELQSMRYNSQTAYRYGENPLAPYAAG